MKVGFIFLILDFGLSSFVCCLNAQVKTDNLIASEGISLEIPSELSGRNGELIQSKIRLINSSDVIFKGKIRIEENQNLDFFGQFQKQIKIDAGEEIFVPINFLIPTNIPVDRNCKFSLVLVGESDNRLLKKDVFVNIEKFRKLRIGLSSDKLHLDSGSSQLNFSVSVSNMGNTDQKAILVVNSSEKLTDFKTEKIEFYLKAFSDTLIDVKKTVRISDNYDDEFFLNLVGLYKNGDFFDQKAIRVQTVRSVRRYHREKRLTKSTESQIGLTRTATGRGFEIYRGLLNSELELKDSSRLHLQFNGMWYKANRELYIRNSWIEFENRFLKAKIGNLYRNYELNISGRGGEIDLRLNSSSRIRAGAVLKSDRLFYSSVNQGGSAWFEYEKNKMVEGSLLIRYLYDTRPYSNRSSIFSFEKNIIKRRLLTIDTEFSNGFSYENKSIHDLKYGASGGINMSFSNQRWQISSKNLYSTSYYPGLMQGVLNLDERIMYSISGKATLWGSYSDYGYSPALSGFGGISGIFSMRKAEMGYRKNFNRLRLFISSIYNYESQDLSYFGNQSSVLQSKRIKSGFSYKNNNGSQELSFSFEGGNSAANNNSKDFVSYLGILNYRYKWLNLDFHYQHGAFHLGETGFGLARLSNYEKFAVSGQVLKYFNSDRIRINLGFEYGYNTQSGHNFNLFSRVEYRLKSGFLLSGGFSQYKYSNVNSRYGSFELGFIKKFGSADLSYSKRTLKLFVFYDFDGDGIFSAGDLAAVGQKVFIDGKAFVTDDKGIVKYKGLPRGIHGFESDSMSEWWASPREIVLDENTQTDIGLSKMTSIRGVVNYLREDYSYELPKKYERNFVIAKNLRGDLFKATVDSNGAFFMFVPKGEYEVSVITANNEEYIDILNNHQKIVTDEAVSIKINFDIEVRSRKVILKKFTSNSSNIP